jgi:predicted PhzF superfamily epimerase YddE/YHI9
VLFEIIGQASSTIQFDSLSGPLKVERDDDVFTLDFPLQRPEPCELPEALLKGLGETPIACLRNEDYLVVFESHEDVAALEPDYELLKTGGARGVIATASSDDYDFVSRFFAPGVGIPEDPVTGSSFTQLAPYWVDRLGKNPLRAKQISARGGEVLCQVEGDRVLISGSAVKFMEGEIDL